MLINDNQEFSWISGIVVHAYNLSNWKVEARGPWIQNQSWLLNEVQVSLDIWDLTLKTNKNTQNAGDDQYNPHW